MGIAAIQPISETETTFDTSTSSVLDVRFFMCSPVTLAICLKKRKVDMQEQLEARDHFFCGDTSIYGLFLLRVIVGVTYILGMLTLAITRATCDRSK